MSESEVWAARAPELASHALRNWVVTPEYWCIVQPLDKQAGGSVIAPRTGMIKSAILQRHFESESVAHLVGLVCEAPIPSYSAVMRSKWMALSATEWPAISRVAERLRSLDFNPVLERYGDRYRALVYFDLNSSEDFENVLEGRPTRLALALVQEHADVEVESVFLLPGLHYSGRSYSKIRDGSHWAHGMPAIDALLTGASPSASLERAWTLMSRTKSLLSDSQVSRHSSTARSQVSYSGPETSRSIPRLSRRHPRDVLPRIDERSVLRPDEDAPRPASQSREHNRIDRWEAWLHSSPTWLRWERSYSVVLAIGFVLLLGVLIGFLSRYLGFLIALTASGLIAMPLLAVAFLAAIRIVAGFVDRWLSGSS